ncbi:hypothetical protein BpHYR1_013666 [Brachionus plicatilis]|uniref:Uncharacterized protein n=1 Tax=Brachionus plicatilis TaxID=10195 RepID=A0A3M7SXN2_BRAPC|nr:hypothetical protein BpHYR1_013666 [Brachionus plicatilis]
MVSNRLAEVSEALNYLNLLLNHIVRISNYFLFKPIYNLMYIVLSKSYLPMFASIFYLNN